MAAEKLTKKERIQELKKQLEEKNKLAEDRLNQLKYLQADFDNYRKNFEKEKGNIIRLANEKIMKELLVILDDLGRALKENSSNKGLSLLCSNFFKILLNNGLKEIECLGKKFDPNFHEVLSKEQSNNEEVIILEEFQKGFILNSKVIRPSQVKISEKILEENKNG